MAVDFDTTVTSSRALAQFPSSKGTTATAANPEDLQRQADRGEFLVRTTALRDALVDLEDLVANTRRRPSRTAAATSVGFIGIVQVSSSAASRVASGEANTITTSFAPSDPDWQGLSSAAASVGGLYDGSDGSGTYTFRAQNSGLRGLNAINIDVLRPDLTTLETINIGASDPDDQVYSLSNGQTVTIGGGTVIADDEFTVEVESGLDFAPDPTKPFNGTGDDDPGLQPGSSIIAGSFEVNGTSINVAADDTINAVVARITDSAAGVTASYDVESELLLLTQKSLGSAQTIDLANDTSGFLAALNLDPGTFSAGLDSDLDRRIDQVAALAAVSSGNFFVNGVEVLVDTSSDSLNDIVARINASDTGARARLIGGQRISVESVNKKADLIVDDGSSGFFTALNIQPQTFEALVGGLSKRATGLIAKSVGGVATQVQKVFNDEDGLGLAKSDVASLQKQFVKIIAKAEDDISRGNKPKFIFDFNFESPATAFELEDNAAGNFQRSLDKFYADFRTTLTGSRDDPDDGLLDGLIRVLDSRTDTLSKALGRLGASVDNFA